MIIKDMIKCECNDEVLVIEEIDDQYYIAIYTLGFPKLRIINRIRYALKILFNGKLYGDQMIVNKKDFHEMINELEK